MSDNMHTFDSNPQTGAVKWLLEMEAVMDPTVQSTIILNIKKLDPAIADVQLIFDTNRKAVLIYLHVKLGWWRKWRKWDEFLVQLVENQMDEALPTYRKRVVTDYTIFEKALKIVGAK